MKRLTGLAAFALAVVIATPALTQRAPRTLNNFASDAQTVPVMANTPGALGAVFETYVAIYNPTASAFAVNATLFDATGAEHDATITLAAGEVKTYTNFLDTVFSYAGGGAVTFESAETTGGTHNNRFIVSAEVRTVGARYGTPVPSLEFAGTSSRSFSPGITVNANTRTNVGCFNQSAAANLVRATVLDSTGTQTLGSVDLNLAANGWGQTALSTIVSGGIVRFEPAGDAVCYAVVVDNGTHDGRFIAAAEYQP